MKSGKLFAGQVSPKQALMFLLCAIMVDFIVIFFVFKYFCVSKTLLFFLKDCGALHTKSKRCIAGTFVHCYR